MDPNYQKGFHEDFLGSANCHRAEGIVPTVVVEVLVVLEVTESSAEGASVSGKGSSPLLPQVGKENRKSKYS